MRLDIVKEVAGVALISHERGRTYCSHIAHGHHVANRIAIRQDYHCVLLDTATLPPMNSLFLAPKCGLVGFDRHCVLLSRLLSCLPVIVRFLMANMRRTGERVRE